ncbi:MULTISPECIES: peptidoglycan recognition protein family protein [Erwinia]|uniref:peptidoglycan recognition protein family protein n=1 Tax=Erwinia TaxID=551 RepID=UPI00105FF6AE|nr:MULTISPECIES: peptidoglycan recognition family protein [Erwinia]MCS3606148.1 N-acetyl-anhydromuramyl-L-alanine amidase AmpD [Erwinia rhapontici]NKG30512.1 N-acetylmuramoyl-L-alanine amidase [Erwinia rhapontici]NNS05722.1 N-acetylmuramoyl-L-alanine amidase [Erwinia sp. JH02]TDS92921.1 N-acetylmuramoyl-L-alanine amidase [Erwinia rhapontici]
MYIDEDGYIYDDRIERKIFKTIERGSLDSVNGIVVHQTASPTAQSTFNSYGNKSANGAHFLIDKDGKVYQTASLFKMTWHVGLVQSKCVLQKVCQPTETRLLALHTKAYWKDGISQEISNIEREKSFPARFPNNTDSIGIEMVGLAIGPDNKEVFEAVTDEQNQSLKWLVSELTRQFQVPMTEVHRHPDIGRKNTTEASTAKWE